jgi:hypothetical protein
MQLLKENLKKLPPKHRTGFILSGLVVLLLVSLDISSWFLPSVDTNQLVVIIVNSLDFTPYFEGESADNFVN